MDEKYTVELVSPVPPDAFDDTVEQVAAVIKKDTDAVSKLLGRGPGKLTKGTSKQKADAFASRLKQAGLDVVVLGEGEKRPAPRPAAAVEAKLVEEQIPPAPAREPSRNQSSRPDRDNTTRNEGASRAGASSAFDDDFGNAPASSAFDDDFEDSVPSPTHDPFADDGFEDDSFNQPVAHQDNFEDDGFDDPASPAASQSFAETDDFEAGTPASDGFDDDFDRDAFDDDGFGTAIRERVPAASQDDKDSPDSKGKKRRGKKDKPTKEAAKKEKPVKKERPKRKAKADKDPGEAKKGSNPVVIGLLIVLLLVFGSAAALILLPEEYTSFVPASVRTSVEQAPEAISGFFVSLPRRVSGLWGGDTTPPVANTPSDAGDTADTGDDGGAILAVPSFDENTDTDPAATDPATTDTSPPADSGDAIVEVTAERIFTAASSGSTEEINALAQAGADFNIRDDFGQTPLVYALNNGQAVIQALINQGANVNAQTNAGWTPLMYAARDAGGNIISVLLQAGADPNITNNDGQTAIQIAQNTPGREGATQIILDSQ